MSQRRYDPWMGEHYHDQGIDGLRLLILGESHHEADGDDGENHREFTKEVIRKLCLEGKYQFFAKVQQLVQGLEPGVPIDQTKRRDFWNRVAFYNYVQQIVGTGPGVPPSDSMWKDAQKPFVETLQELRPHMVLILGQRLSEHVPKDLIPPEIERCDVEHPSSWGFQVTAFQDKVAKHMANAMSKLSGAKT